MRQMATGMATGMTSPIAPPGARRMAPASFTASRSCSNTPAATGTSSQRLSHLLMARRLRPGMVRAFGTDDDDGIDAARMSLDRMMQATNSSTTLTGKELRGLVFDKWGHSFDVRLLQRAGKTYMHIMWKFLEQASFPLTDEEYQEQLDAVAELCALWGVSDIVRQGISSASPRGPGYSVGGAAKAIQIVLGRNLSMLENGR